MSNARLPIATSRPAKTPQVVQWPDVDTEFLGTLPPVLRAIVRALGFDRACEWLNDHGGINHNIPSAAEQALGLAAQELARLRITLEPHLDANGRVALPKADKLLRKIRNTQIRRERPRASLAKLAIRYRLTSRQIQNICGDDQEQAQLDLF